MIFKYKLRHHSQSPTEFVNSSRFTGSRFAVR